MRFVAMFLWLIVPAAAVGTYSLYGLPHMIWSYRFEDNGDPYNPLVARHYLECSFVGPYGSFTIPADAGRCAWIRFFRASSGQ